MSWTDVCKIQAVETITKLVENDGITKTAAIRKISRESDIPANTIEKWVYPRKQEDGSAGNGVKTKRKKKTPSELLNKAVLTILGLKGKVTDDEYEAAAATITEEV